MTRFLAGRLLHATAIVFLVATFVFVLIHLAPGDPFATGSDATVPSEVRARLRRDFGLDRSLPEQYTRYLGRLVRGDLGQSFAEHRSVAAVLAARVPNTLLLTGCGLLVSFGLGIAIGVFQGARPGSKRDDILSFTTLGLYSVPVFWLGLVLLLVFGEKLGWLPVGGAIDPVRHAHFSLLGRVWDRLVHLLLPVMTLGAVGAAVTARYQRGAMLDVIRREYVRAARARGLPEQWVLWRHALRNALLPTITLFGLTFPFLLGGAVLVESVFSWPGLGKLAIDSVATRDYYVVTATAIVAAAMVVLGNLLADLLYWIADPRTRGPA